MAKLRTHTHHFLLIIPLFLVKIHNILGDNIPVTSHNAFNQEDLNKNKAQAEQLRTQFICQPHVTVNTPPQPTPVQGCNCSTTRTIVSQEVSIAFF